jgi:hypothetical protein
MPEVEPRIDLQQVEAPIGGALEVDLRDAPELEPAEHLAPKVGDVRSGGDLDRGAVPIAPGASPDLRPVNSATSSPSTFTYAW